MKRCSKCKKQKDESEFYKNARTRDGLKYQCKACELKYLRLLYRKKHKSVRRRYSYKESHRVVGSVKQKRCSRCNKWKAESEYYKKRKHKDGLSHWCKKCSDKANNDARRRRRLAARN